MFNEIKTHELTVDVVVFAIKNSKLKVLLTKRNREPFKNKFAIPGGFIRLSETLDEAAARVLKEGTGIEDIFLRQLYTFGDPLRYPNARVITCAYYALIKAEDALHMFDENNQNPDVAWHEVYNLPDMAFDHLKIIDFSLTRIKQSLGFYPTAFRLLDDKFTLTELQHAYELILNKSMDKRNFRKKILATGFLIETEEYSKTGSKRPAKLFCIDKKFLTNETSSDRFINFIQ